MRGKTKTGFNLNHNTNFTEFPGTYWYSFWPYVKKLIQKQYYFIYILFCIHCFWEKSQISLTFCKKIVIFLDQVFIQVNILTLLEKSLTCASKVRNPEKHQSFTTQNFHTIQLTWTENFHLWSSLNKNHFMWILLCKDSTSLTFWQKLFNFAHLFVRKLLLFLTQTHKKN